MKKHLYRAVIVLLSLVMIISAFNIVSYYIEANTQEKIYNALIDSTKAEDNEDNLSSDSSGEPVILSKYSEIFKQNTDMVGWVKIEGTKINYPVMLSVNEPDFYLTHGFDKKYTVYGCPYVKEDCDVLAPSDNIVIYGHNMKNGTMFAELERYKEKSFWEAHSIISFDTIYKTQNYMIFAAFETEVNTNSPDLFEYYAFTDARTVQEYNSFITKCKEISFYDTGYSAEYGEKLITLSTCSRNDNNKRIVVIACSID